MKEGIKLFDTKTYIYKIDKNDTWKIFLLLFPSILLLIPELHKYFNKNQLIVLYIIYLTVVLVFAWKILVKKYPKPSIHIIRRD